MSDEENDEPTSVVDLGKCMTTVSGLFQHKMWEQRAAQLRMPLSDFEHTIVKNITQMLTRDVNLQCRANIVNTLDLSRRGITAKVLQNLLQKKLIARTVTELDLSENPLGKEGIELLSEQLLDYNCSIHTLRLASCGLDQGDAIATLADALSNAHLLVDLDISRNNLEADHLDMLAQGIRTKARTLHRLVLSGNNLTVRNLGMVQTLRVHTIVVAGMGAGPQLDDELTQWEQQRAQSYRDSILARIDAKKRAKTHTPGDEPQDPEPEKQPKFEEVGDEQNEVAVPDNTTTDPQQTENEQPPPADENA